VCWLVRLMQAEGKPGLLTCLFPNDTGATSPRLSNSHIMTSDGGYVDTGVCSWDGGGRGACGQTPLRVVQPLTDLSGAVCVCACCA
jgi:hypothetical protein